MGAVGVPGSSIISSGIFTVLGSGSRIGGTSDEFHYVYQSLSGDGEIRARITSVQNTSTNSKGGIMIRGSLAADAPSVAMVLTGGNRFQFQVRSTAGGTTSSWSGSQTPPHWVRLVRSGNTIATFYTVDFASLASGEPAEIPAAVIEAQVAKVR